MIPPRLQTLVPLPRFACPSAWAAGEEAAAATPTEAAAAQAVVGPHCTGLTHHQTTADARGAIGPVSSRVSALGAVAQVQAAARGELYMGGQSADDLDGLLIEGASQARCESVLLGGPVGLGVTSSVFFVVSAASGGGGARGSALQLIDGRGTWGLGWRGGGDAAARVLVGRAAVGLRLRVGPGADPLRVRLGVS